MNVIWNGFYNPEPSDERRFDGTGALLRMILR